MTHRQLRPTRLLDRYLGPLLILPSLAFLVLFLLYPILANVYIGFTNKNLLRSAERVVWFANYLDTLTDPLFLNGLANSII